MKRLILATTLTAVALATVTLRRQTLAQSPADHSAHQHSTGWEDRAHGSGHAGEPASRQGPARRHVGGMGGAGGGMPMMGDMKNMMGSMSMMNTMGMMQSMRMMGAGMGGMATIDRIEGRIAFLKVELKITDAQTEVWNGFADALRANAARLGEVRGSMAKPGHHTDAGRPSRPAGAMALGAPRRHKSHQDGLHQTERDAIGRAKKTADDLLAPHMGIAAMTMMPPPAQPGETRGARRSGP